MPSNTETGRATARPWEIEPVHGADHGFGPNVVGFALVEKGNSRRVLSDLFDLDTDEHKANAALIVRAVNHHDELVELVRELASELAGEIRDKYGANHPDGIHPAQQDTFDLDMSTVRDARRILTKIGATDG